MDTQPDQDLLENVAAIAATMHSDRATYDLFYRRYGRDLGGFSGIYQLCVCMAREFAKASPVDWGDYPDTWDAAIERFVESMLTLDSGDKRLRPSNPRLQRRLARSAIRWVPTDWAGT